MKRGVESGELVVGSEEKSESRAENCALLGGRIRFYS